MKLHLILLSLLALGSSMLPVTATASVLAQVPLQLHAIVPHATSSETASPQPALPEPGVALPGAATLTNITSVPSRTAALSHLEITAPELALLQHTPTGNDVLQKLPTLFVLNALFANESSGLLTHGPASLHNILTLYEIFFDH